MRSIRITPEVDAAGDIFLDVKEGEAGDRVGPLQAGMELLAVLDPPDHTKGASPPTKRMKKISQKQERRNAELFGGRVQPGSGSGKRAKGDFRVTGSWRGESKFTFARRYGLELAVLEKIASECGEGEKPVLCLDFKNKTADRMPKRYVVLHETDFEELLNAAGKHR